MPTVYLQGGLGNQLFQYAVGRALSIRSGSPLYLDVTQLSNPSPPAPPRSFQLSPFNIQGTVTRWPIEHHPTVRLRLKLFILMEPIFPWLTARILQVHKDTKSQRFTPHVLNLPGNVLLFGYYQSAKYFRSISDTLKKELSVETPPSRQNQAWISKIQSTPSVSLHIRRGDYTEQGWSLPAAYYQSAIERVHARIDEPELFVFSDDTTWTSQNLKRLLPDGVPRSNVHLVKGNGAQEAFEDFRLMRNCRHHIIANSTFSWWGAWLALYPNKTVFAPAYWLGTPVDTLDILPTDWIPLGW